MDGWQGFLDLPSRSDDRAELTPATGVDGWLEPDLGDRLATCTDGY